MHAQQQARLYPTVQRRAAAHVRADAVHKCTENVQNSGAGPHGLPHSPDHGSFSSLAGYSSAM
eukprot:1159878-Pelagomonas_calceolata.AAC.14